LVKKIVLVVDDELLTCKLVRSVLLRRGYDVEMAENGLIGFQKAVDIEPDLMITDIFMPVSDGFDLVRKVRSVTTLALMPIIMLSARDEAENRVRGFRLGADDFLPKPFFPEDLVLRVRKVLEKAEHLKAAVRREMLRAENEEVVPDFSGDLRYIGFSTLITMFEMEAKTGALSLTFGNLSGLLLVRDGKIVSAQSYGLVTVSGKEAVYDFLSWGQGRFVFTTTAVDCVDQIATTTQTLLFEAARRMDESAR
jgi:DNA-binding response OmpR family regulator